MRALLTAALVLLTGLTAVSAMCADVPYSAQVTAVQNTQTPYTWTYTVQNTSTQPQYTLWAFGIEVDGQTDPVYTAAPRGWTANTDQEHLVLWTYSGELAPGAQKTGFQVTFTGLPEFQRFTAQFDDSVTGAVPVFHGVVSAPEPAGVAVLFTGLAPIIGYALRRKSRS